MEGYRRAAQGYIQGVKPKFSMNISDGGDPSVDNQASVVEEVNCGSVGAETGAGVCRYIGSS